MPDELTVARAAEIWDEFAQQFMALSPDIRWTTAQSAEQREAIYRARYEEVIRQGWAAPEDMPDGLECDEYDDEALQLAGWDGDQMIIVGRLAFPSAGHQLPTESSYEIEIAPHGQVVDAGRAILLHADRSDPKHKLFLGLMSLAWHEMRARGYYHVCATMTRSMLRLYRLMGIHWEVLGEPRPYWGELRYPCKYNLVQTVQSFEKQRDRFFGGAADC